jgi:hypothetical protein
MTAFLILFAIASGWVLSLLVHPFGRCWLCAGRGNIRRKRKRKRRAPKCPLCHGGLKPRQRLGSRTVHRIRRQVLTHWRVPR